MEEHVALMPFRPIHLFECSHLETQGKALSTRVKEELAKHSITEKRWEHLAVVMDDNGREIPFADLDGIPREGFPVKVALRGVPARVEPEMLVKNFKEEASMLHESFPAPSRINLMLGKTILLDDVQLKDYKIKDGSTIVVEQAQTKISAPTDGSKKETANAPTLSLRLTASYDPAIEKVTSLGFSRDYVEKSFFKAFGNVDGTADYTVPEEVHGVQIPREDGWMDVSVAKAEPATGREIEEAQKNLMLRMASSSSSSSSATINSRIWNAARPPPLPGFDREIKSKKAQKKPTMASSASAMPSASNRVSQSVYRGTMIHQKDELENQKDELENEDDLYS